MSLRVLVAVSSLLVVEGIRGLVGGLHALELPTCGIPPAADVKEYFIEQRVHYGVAGTCTKRDVCLLMRQLDMDFYERRGVIGNPKGTSGWVSSQSCATHKDDRGFFMIPVTDATACQSAASKKFPGSKITFATVSDASLPPGCAAVRGHPSHAGQPVKLYLNELAESDGKAGVNYDRKFPTNTEQFCTANLRLSEEDANYFSPYKMKKSMISGGYQAMSTSCSFGMMADLAAQDKTTSECARILSAKSQASQVLLDKIANHWCPDIWTHALSSGSTCSVRHTGEVAKQALLEAACDVEDEPL